MLCDPERINTLSRMSNEESEADTLTVLRIARSQPAIPRRGEKKKRDNTFMHLNDDVTSYQQRRLVKTSSSPLATIQADPSVGLLWLGQWGCLEWLCFANDTETCLIKMSIFIESTNGNVARI